MLSEAKIIASLKSSFPKFIGDDAAVIEKHGEQRYVVTNDLLVEDVHFCTRYFDPLSLAHKALHSNLSDIAAMGAKPRFILLGASIPLSKQKYVEDFLHHFVLVCKKASVTLIGGDTTKSPDKLFISVTVIGTAKAANIKYRHTAQPGDLICVAGNLGHAHVGLMACEKSLGNLAQYQKACLRPQAKMNEGLWISGQAGVHAMMDISDGLFIDLKRLCESSNLQGIIDLDRLNPTENFIAVCEAMGFNPREIMLTGGEDFGLLFTAEPSGYDALSKAFMQKFGYEIKQLGFIAKGNGIRFTERGVPIEMKLKPFSHFGESLDGGPSDLSANNPTDSST